MAQLCPTKRAPLSLSRLTQLRRAVQILLMGCLIASASPSGWAQSSHSAHNTQPFNVLPLAINGVTMVGGQLYATGTLGSHPFMVPAVLTAAPASTAACPVLNLQIPQGIHLNLLGLNVDTSPICLAITAIPGNGNLLGNLLCQVAGLLNGGTSLSAIFSGQAGVDAGALSSALGSVLNNALGLLTSSSAVTGASCSILNLSLGPVALNLLGLSVNLDNCSGGPVTLTITAQPGAGQLLGNLLCDLSNLLNNGNANPRAIYVTLLQVAQAIQSLV